MTRFLLPLLLCLVSVSAFCEEASSEAPLIPNQAGISVAWVPHYKLINDLNDPTIFELDEKSFYGTGLKFSLHLPLPSEILQTPLTLNYSQYTLDSDNPALDPNIRNLSFGTYFVGPFFKREHYDFSIGYLPELGVTQYHYEVGDTGRWYLFAELGIDVGVTIEKHFRFSSGFTWHLIGLPGETVGYGHYCYGKFTVLF